MRIGEKQRQPAAVRKARSPGVTLKGNPEHTGLGAPGRKDPLSFRIHCRSAQERIASRIKYSRSLATQRYKTSFDRPRPRNDDGLYISTHIGLVQRLFLRDARFASCSERAEGYIVHSWDGLLACGALFTQLFALLCAFFPRDLLYSLVYKAKQLVRVPLRAE